MHNLILEKYIRNEITISNILTAINTRDAVQGNIYTEITNYIGDGVYGLVNDIQSEFIAKFCNSNQNNKQLKEELLHDAIYLFKQRILTVFQQIY